MRSKRRPRSQFLAMSNAFFCERFEQQMLNEMGDSICFGTCLEPVVTYIPWRMGMGYFFRYYPYPTFSSDLVTIV
jgi:hypothetical protein